MCGGAGALIDFLPIGQIFDNPTGFYINSNKSLAARTEKYYKRFPLSSSFQTSLSMRSNLLASFLVAMLLAGCAFEGTVVEKRSRQLPDSSMIGTEGVYSFAFRGPTGTSRPPITVPNPQFWTETNGMYSFLLRDQQGNVRSQMVTAGGFRSLPGRRLLQRSSSLPPAKLPIQRTARLSRRSFITDDTTGWLRLAEHTARWRCIIGIIPLNRGRRLRFAPHTPSLRVELWPSVARRFHPFFCRRSTASA